MSDATERPAVDADAWATACAEDLQEERARRRERYGQQTTGTAGEELRKLLDAVAEKMSSLQNPLFGLAGQGAVQQLIGQAKSAVEPVIERNPQVFDHLAAAGNELLAAYRSAVEGHERRWTRNEPSGGADGTDRQDRRDEGPGPSEKIDLD
ncbi:DUF5304 domain-containing protein [Streptomyces wuyuanensis]|uniref:DUF5304 domain-containing protein n=1 Tax=Streptomyces wuyuanensis TaxID=1196353 RepID=A0A1G9QX56_9ACTN|nr:DUF5304 domain-containing protein [Streptomyces wuyuanensis]SDM15564.1 hypothetical protein SAMN05444921_104340 [Streptomyces wuyuanensis]